MVQPFRRLRESPSQTAGPYVHIGAAPNFSGIEGVFPHDLGSLPLPAEAQGQRIAVTGRVFDGAGSPIRDALIEIWQADAQGLYPGPGERRGQADPHFPGWFRQPVDTTTGIYRFETIKPGIVPYFDGRPMAPHISFWIVARGINIGLHTRLYFGDEDEANAADPILARIEHRVRVPTLIATLSDVGSVPTYTFDIRLQGENETVFFDI
jgi:protocatechuate 3,4-dioxygenase alpha subunit